MKIAVIGGGSSYTPELLEGLIENSHVLGLEEVWLCDVPEGQEKLQVIEQLANRMVKAADNPFTVNATLERKDAIVGADYVITQIRVGQLEMRRKDEYIPLKYGVIGQETTGPGGFMKALRTIPVILDICKDIEELAPDAWLFNFTNPAGVVTEAVLKYSKVKTVGLCNNPINYYKKFAAHYGVSLEDVSIDFVGINHLNWITDYYIQGESKLHEVLAGKQAAYEAENIPSFDWEPSFLQSLGAIPSGYHKYYYQQDKVLKKQLGEFKENRTRADQVKEIEAELFEKYKDPDLSEKPKELEKRGGAYYSEAAVQLIKSVHLNLKRVHTLNVQNNGAIACLPDDACVEVNCVVENHRVTPLQTDPGKTSPQIRGLLQVVKAYEELTVEAAVKKDKGIAIQALSIHPLVPSYEIAESILNDMLAANKNYVDGF